MSLRKDAGLRNRPVHVDLEVFEDGGGTGIEGRLDLRFLFSTGAQHPWPYLAAEAKRLHVTHPCGKWASLISEYVTGDQGMMCFISGRYSGQQLYGVMIGYIFDGQTQKAREGIASSISNNQRQVKLSPGGMLKASDEPGVWQSEHRRRKGRITLLHLFQAV